MCMSVYPSASLEAAKAKGTPPWSHSLARKAEGCWKIPPSSRQHSPTDLPTIHFPLYASLLSQITWYVKHVLNTNLLGLLLLNSTHIGELVNGNFSVGRGRLIFSVPATVLVMPVGVPPLPAQINKMQKCIFERRRQIWIRILAEQRVLLLLPIRTWPNPDAIELKPGTTKHVFNTCNLIP